MCCITQGKYSGAMTLSRIAFSIITLSIKAYFVTLGMNDIENKQLTPLEQSDIMLSVTFNLLLC